MPDDNSRGATVLVADDCDDIRALYCNVLNHDGWKTLEASDGSEALAKILATKPDIVMLDQHMPGLRGTEVYEQLRRRNILMPVILVAAESDIASLAKGVGIEHYLGKPTTPDELKELIRSVHAKENGG